MIIDIETAKKIIDDYNIMIEYDVIDEMPSYIQKMINELPA